MANYNWPSITTQSAPIQYELDGVPVNVSEDTVDPNQSTPLPVKVTNPAGLPVDFATETTLAAMSAKVATEAKQDDAIVILETLATEATLQTVADIDFATEATLATLAAVDFATEATLLDIAAVDFATETTLATIAAKTIDTDDVTVVASALPTGAATEAKQDAGITAIGLTSRETTLAAMSAKLPASLGAKTSAASLSVTIASDSTAGKLPAATGTFAQIVNLVATAQTLTPPAGAVAFKIQAPSTNTENIAFSLGATATITAGILMEPGRSEDFEAATAISVIATNSTVQTVNVLWRITP